MNSQRAMRRMERPLPQCAAKMAALHAGGPQYCGRRRGDRDGASSNRCSQFANCEHRYADNTHLALPSADVGRTAMECRAARRDASPHRTLRNAVVVGGWLKRRQDGGFPCGRAATGETPVVPVCRRDGGFPCGRAAIYCGRGDATGETSVVPVCRQDGGFPCGGRGGSLV